MIRFDFLDRCCPPPGGGGDSGGDSVGSGLARFPRPSASATLSFSSFCAVASSQHWSSVIGSIFSVIFSNSPSTLSVTWSHIGGILSSSTVPGSFSFFTMLPFSSSYSLSLSEDEYSLLLPSSLSPRHRTFRRVKSGGCDRLRFSHRSNIRTATRNDTRPYLACAPGVHSNHTDGLGGAQFLGTKNSRPSVPCRSSGWS